MAEEKKDPAEEYMGKLDDVINFERDTSLNIYQRIHAVMKDVWYVQKKQNQNHYNTVEHDDVTRKVRPALIKYGIVCVPIKIKTTDPKTIVEKKYNSRDDREYEVINYFTEAKVFIKFVNIDNPDDFTVGVAYGHGLDRAGNAPGKAISYAAKYIMIKTLYLETGDEEDTYHLVESDPDPNAAFIYNMLGEELFGKEDWEEKGKKKIYQITRGKTSDASRANPKELNIAIRNLYELSRKKSEAPDKKIEEIEKEQEKDTMNDILKDFED